MREEVGHAPNRLGPGIVHCDTQAQCLFDEAPNPHVQVIVHILNERGKEGRGLGQIGFRQKDLIWVWRREL